MDSVLEGPDPGERELVELMIGYQSGRIEPFERLYVVLAPVLERYFGARTSHAAPDLVQETFLEIHRARHTYTPPLPVRPWVFGVARNVERRYWRRGRRHQARLDALARGAAAAEAPRWGLPELNDALRRLPGPGREPWELHHIHGFTFVEIGERLRIEAGAARLRAHRAMVALRALLGIERGKRNE